MSETFTFDAAQLGPMNWAGLSVALSAVVIAATAGPWEFVALVLGLGLLWIASELNWPTALPHRAFGRAGSRQNDRTPRSEGSAALTLAPATSPSQCLGKGSQTGRHEAIVFADMIQSG